ncbi:MAG: hypothetical protein ACFFE8_13635 [Candidatus Heimdallarchaeota archaeon]
MITKGTLEKGTFLELPFDQKFSGLDEGFEKWLDVAKDRIFSLAAGNRIAQIAPRIMRIGYAKVLYGVNQLGADVEASKSFVIFAPDGTCSFNGVRTKRGFAYGAVLDMEFDGLIATNNSMPNGCGYSLYELIDPLPDDQLFNLINSAYTRLGEDQINQLGKGNHFSAIYYVKDPLSGEDSGRRFVAVHCSGHVGTDTLYYPEKWLKDTAGYHEIHTPHGKVILLEDDAKSLYLKRFQNTDTINTFNRDHTMESIFKNQQEWRILSKITHQGLINDGKVHLTGTQIAEGIVPIAFNPEEGLIGVEIKPNLNAGFVDRWEYGQKIKDMGVYDKVKALNFAPHGGGYEFRFPLEYFNVHLGPNGIDQFDLQFKGNGVQLQFRNFREIRNWMTYRRKTPLVHKMGESDLVKIIYDMPCLIQIYPHHNVPGGHS